MVYCPHYATQNPDGQKFCGNCGKEMVIPSAPAQPQLAPAPVQTQYQPAPAQPQQYATIGYGPPMPLSVPIKRCSSCGYFYIHGLRGSLGYMFWWTFFTGAFAAIYWALRRKERCPNCKSTDSTVAKDVLVK